MPADLSLGLIALSLAAAFIIGTLGLWLLSATVNTHNATFKAAAFYNVLMMALGVALVVVGIVSVAHGAPFYGEGFWFSAIITFTIGFLVLKQLYDLSLMVAFLFLAATLAFQRMAVKVVELLFVNL